MCVCVTIALPFYVFSFSGFPIMFSLLLSFSPELYNKHTHTHNNIINTHIHTHTCHSYSHSYSHTQNFRTNFIYFEHIRCVRVSKQNKTKQKKSQQQNKKTKKVEGNKKYPAVLGHRFICPPTMSPRPSRFYFRGGVQ